MNAHVKSFNKTPIAEYLFDKFLNVELSADNLHGYQNTAVDFLIGNPFSALFIDTGLGKTPISLYAIYRLVQMMDVENVLVIAPKRVANVTWPDEIATWSFAAALSFTIIRDDELVDAVNDAGREARKMAKLAGHDKKAQDALSDEARSRAAKKAVRELMVRKPGTIHLISKDMVDFLVDAWGRDWPYDCVFVDESSGLKDHRTNRWKALWKVRPLIKRFHQLTATPASESYIHLYGQITLLDRGQRFGLSYTKFCEKYFTQNRYTMKWALREGAEELISALIADICLVMKQEDYLELQKPITSPHYVHLTEAQMALYLEMEREFVVDLPDGSQVEAETAAALSQKLLQMASGVLYETVLDEQPNGDFKKRRVVHHIHDEKIEALRQLAEETEGECLLIAYYHQSSAERILAAFPDAKVMDKEGKLIKEWNKGKIKKLLLHPQSGAHGLNLQKGGRHVVFFDYPWSYELYYQFWRRLARQGQTLLVVIHHLIARGTIDELLVECLNEKRDAQEVLFEWIKKMRRKFKPLATPEQFFQAHRDTDLVALRNNP